MRWLRPLTKGYHRCEVHGLDDFPQGGALVVGNHSGGLFAMDVPVFATGFYEKFGFDRPVYTLSHDIIFAGPTGELLPQDRLHPRQPRERRRGTALRRSRRRLPRRGLRRLPADADREHDRLRRPHRLRAGRAQRRGADRAGGVDRRPGGAAVPLPRRVDGQGVAAGQAAPGQDPAHLDRLPVRPVGGASGERAAAHQDRHARAAADRRRRPSSARSPTSTRWTRTSAGSCSEALDELARARRMPVLG